MLTVPVQIKTLYKTDGVYKNFRAHFPNGERADITNSDIVRESLSFTESICSDNMLRFGGCERSSISFETVGVENILGLWIECGIEIDTTSLSAADLTAIQADPGDGVLVLAADSDIGRGYYRIPLGVFQVQSCPRDHQAMTHRQVSALSPKPWRVSPVEAGKMNWWAGGKKYTVNALAFVLACIGANDPAFMTTEGWVKTQKSFPTPSTYTMANSALLTDENGDTVTVSYSANVRAYLIPWYNMADSSPLGALSLGDLDAAGLADFIRTCCAEAEIDWDASNIKGYAEAVTGPDDFMRLVMGGVMPSVLWLDPFSNWNYTRTVLEGDIAVLSGQGPSYDDAQRYRQSVMQGGNLRFVIPESIQVSFSRSAGTPYSESFSTGISNKQPKAWVWSNSQTDPLALMSLKLPLAGQVTGQVNSSSRITTWSSWNAPKKMDELISGYMELKGIMLYPGRGEVKQVRLSRLSPVSILPGEYENVWWDDYNISPVGRVTYRYGENHDKTGRVTVGSGASVYDLRDNAVLSAVEAKPTDIQAFIKAGLKPALKELGGYCPAEIEMPAWPWLEPGDRLNIQTEDGVTVATYLLKRTISGVQMLRDSIEAPGGEVVVGDE